jgi:hypothetical protein
MGILL